MDELHTNLENIQRNNHVQILFCTNRNTRFYHNVLKPVTLENIPGTTPTKLLILDTQIADSVLLLTYVYSLPSKKQEETNEATIFASYLFEL